MIDRLARRRRMLARLALVVATLTGGPALANAQRMLVPMDDGQTNHLKAYGLTYNAIKAGLQAEWLLNYRGGAFLLPDAPELRRRAGLDGISVEAVSDAQLGAIRREMAGGNMESVPLEKAPKIAVYSPPDAQPWDDAVTLALKYAGIEFTAVYDTEVERGDLTKYDWLHLHHEDFTGQFNKFHLGYRDAPWFRELVAKNQATAKKLGFVTVPALKKDVAEHIRQFVERGGFLFAMCGATETLELAIAANGVDIAGEFADGTPMDPNSDAKMQWRRSFAFKDAHLEHSPFVNSMSDIDGHQVNVAGRQGISTMSAARAASDAVWSALGAVSRTRNSAPLASAALINAGSLTAALVHEYRLDCISPLASRLYLIRTEIGMPRPVILLRALQAILASVF